MELHFKDLALTIRAGNVDIPFGLDEALFLTVRSHLLELLCSNTEIFCFGMASDNAAAAKDELLQNRIFYRIIGYEKNLGIDLENSAEEILNAFHYLVENFKPRWTTIFVEEEQGKKELTIELQYQEVF